MSNNAISINDVCFAYEKEAVLKNICLQVKESSLFFIMGNNGSGKTTLLKNILGYLSPNSGIIEIKDSNIATINRKTLSKLVSYVPQAISLNTDFSVIDFLSLGRTPYLGLMNKLQDDDYEIIDKYAEEMGISKILDVPFNNLSGGQKQLVAITRSLIQDTPVIVMDEPMSALDIGKQADLLRELSILSTKGKTIVLTTHNPNHALVVESTSCFVKDGEIAAWGNSREIISEELLQSVFGKNISLNRGEKTDSIVFTIGE